LGKVKPRGATQNLGVVERERVGGGIARRQKREKYQNWG